MTISFDPDTNQLSHNGEVVGIVTFEGRNVKVRFSLAYKADTESWILPISWLGYGLSLLEELPSKPLLVIEHPEDAIAEWYPVKRTLLEFIVKRDGFVWKFHKTDPDNWPSPLHGHDYEKRLKVDALDGEIYDTGTKERCGKLRKNELKDLQRALRSSKDFQKLAVSLLGDEKNKGPI